MDFKLCIVRIFVADWQASLDFYSKVLGMSVLFENAEMGWAELDTGAAHLALERIDPDNSEAANLLGRFVAASLEVEEIDRVYEAFMEAGVVFLGPPEKQAWGGTLAHFQDPDGNVLTLLGA
jgi:lactoylglutathione lyase